MKEGKILRIVVGELLTNCWILKEDDFAFIIDPGDEAQKILSALKEIKEAKILITHAHPDHWLAAEEVKNALGAEIFAAASKNDVMTFAQFFRNCPEFPSTKKIKEGDIIRGKEISLRVIETPGHSSDSVCFISPYGIFSGDILFRGSVGRWDLPLADRKVLFNSLQRLQTFPDETKIFPGHGEPTTLKAEFGN